MAPHNLERSSQTIPRQVGKLLGSGKVEPTARLRAILLLFPVRVVSHAFGLVAKVACRDGVACPL